VASADDLDAVTAALALGPAAVIFELSDTLRQIDLSALAPDLASVLSDAMRRVRDLHGIVVEVLALARLGPDQWLVGAPHPLGQLMGEVENRWHDEVTGRGRRLLVNVAPETTTIEVAGTLVTQILNVLIDNALRHGLGAVTLTARETSETLAVDVADEGSIAMDSTALFERGTSGGEGHGIDLALARSLAEASGGRLMLAARAHPTFTLFLPANASEASPAPWLEAGLPTNPPADVLTGEAP